MEEKLSVTKIIEQFGGVRRKDFSCAFLYLRDPAYISSPSRTAIEGLDIKGITVTTAERVVKELRIKHAPHIITKIPSAEEQKYIIPSLGIGGRALSATLVHLYFDPGHQKVVESLMTWKARQVAHELNHIARFQAGKKIMTLLDNIISEGLATYQEEFFGGIFLPTPWGNKLNQEEIVVEWEKAKLELDNPRYDYRGWFFGAGGMHPVWAGYALGNEIVRAYAKNHPNFKMRDLVRMDSKTILRKSGWQG